MAEFVEQYRSAEADDAGDRGQHVPCGGAAWSDGRKKIDGQVKGSEEPKNQNRPVKADGNSRNSSESKCCFHGAPSSHKPLGRRFGCAVFPTRRPAAPGSQQRNRDDETAAKGYSPLCTR